MNVSQMIKVADAQALHEEKDWGIIYLWKPEGDSDRAIEARIEFCERDGEITVPIPDAPEGTSWSLHWGMHRPRPKALGPDSPRVNYVFRDKCPEFKW